MISFDVLCLKCLETFTLTSPYAAFPLCCLKCRQEIIFDDGFYTENAEVDKGFYIANKIIKDTLSLSLINKSDPDLIFLFTNQSIAEHKVSDHLIRYIYWDLERVISERFGKESVMWGELVHAAVVVIKENLRRSLNYEHLRSERPGVLKEILEQKIKRISELSDADRCFDIDMECLTFELSALRELSDELQNEDKNALIQPTKTDSKNIPQFYRKQIVDTAVDLTEKFDKWTETHLIETLGISKSTFYDRKKAFGWEKLALLRIEVQEIIKDKYK